MNEKKDEPTIDFYDKDYVLKTDFYMHLCVVNSINAMSHALVREGKILDAYSVIRVNCYLLEKLAWSGGLLNDNDDDYKAYLLSEREKLIKDGLRDDEPIFKALVALAKIAYIQKKIESLSPMYNTLQL